MNLTYKDCDGTEQPLTEWHLHELLDRLHLMQNMWEMSIQNHPACEVLCQKLASMVQTDIGFLYQKIGRISFDEFERIIEE